MTDESAHHISAEGLAALEAELHALETRAAMAERGEPVDDMTDRELAAAVRDVARGHREALEITAWMLAHPPGARLRYGKTSGAW